MAAKFKLGQNVTLAVAIPKGPVVALDIDNEGNIQYLVSYKDAEGVAQVRWFKEDELALV